MKVEWINYFSMISINTRGLSVLFLIVVILIMVTIGYLFSYIIPTKQKSIRFPIYSTQAFFIAQSGVEFAIRYSSQNNWRTPAQLTNLNGIIRNLGRGQFMLSYDSNIDKLYSTGIIQNVSERKITVSNFTQFVTSNALIIDPDRPLPCQTTILIGKRTVTVLNFYIKNVSTSNIVLNSFQSSWVQNPPIRRISSIFLSRTPRFIGNYNSGDPPTNFILPYPINSGSTVSVSIRFSNVVNNLRSIIFTLYDNTGNIYNFNLDPEGDGLPQC